MSIPGRSFGSLASPRVQINRAVSLVPDLHHQVETGAPMSGKDLAQVGWGDAEATGEITLSALVEVLAEFVHGSI